MLALQNITKQYIAGDTKVDALRGVTIGFRKNEFVSILGHSGCGKTTLLNIIGGLDRYTSGDLLINGKSTKTFKDSDWDSYRNHSIGFVFQSYNLIPHQTILTNVELALTISGVSKAERRTRAKEALTRVGLGNQCNKKPNQLSGGQMQRVAIARSIINNPDILLADEPTGALDTETSIQIMEILKEIAKDRLVIMVTHNPDLAEKYSTRIIRLQDGIVVDDNDPYPIEEASKPQETNVKKKKALSFPTAFSLSLNNLMTKKARTFLTSFAGSIGIIGIALILALSNGINAYIADVQEDALSSYPITIKSETQDYSELLLAMTGASESRSREIEDDIIYIDDSMLNMISAMMSSKENDLASFKSYLEEHADEIQDLITSISYTYDFQLQVYSTDRKTQVNPTTIIDNMGDSFSGMASMMSSSSSLYSSYYSQYMTIFEEMIDNEELLKSQYDIIGGAWAEDSHEVMLVVSENNSLTNLVLYALGLKDQSELAGIVSKTLAGETVEFEDKEYTYEDFIGMTFYVVPNSDFYIQTDQTYEVDGVTYPIWEDVRNREDYDQESFTLEHGIPVTISGIIKPNSDAVSSSLSGVIAYRSSLNEEMMEIVQRSAISIQQISGTPGYDVTTGLPFDDGRYDNLSDESKSVLFERWISSETTQKATIMLNLLSTSTDSLVDAKLQEMSLEERCSYVANRFATLASTSPEDFKELILMMVAMNPDSQMSSYIDQLQEMDASAFVEMVKSTGNIDEMYSSEEAIDSLQTAFLSMSSEKIDSAAKSLLSNELSSASVSTLMEQYTTAQLAEMFDETFAQMSQSEKASLYDKYMPSMVSENTYDENLTMLGYVDTSSPASIKIYPKNFASKDALTEFISEYNEQVGDEKAIEYSDVVGIMMSSVTIIINVISYVLIAFVSISLVVSSIMIGVITYISVLERTKEIGILRAIGASKKDISRVFNAETFIVGLCAGLIGIGLSLLLCIPINLIVQHLSGISTIRAILPVTDSLILVTISVVLTLIAGLIPSRLAARKDPVLALRTE